MRNQPYIPPEAGITLGFSEESVIFITRMACFFFGEISDTNHLLLDYVAIVQVNNFDNEEFDILIDLACTYIRTMNMDESYDEDVESAVKTATLWRACIGAEQDYEYYNQLPSQIRNVIDKGVDDYEAHLPAMNSTMQGYGRGRGGRAPAPQRGGRQSMPPRGGNRPIEPTPRRNTNAYGGRAASQRGGGLPLRSASSVANNAMQAPGFTNRATTGGRPLSAADIRGSRGGRGRGQHVAVRETGASRDLGFGGGQPTTSVVDSRTNQQPRRTQGRTAPEPIDRSNYVDRNAHLNNEQERNSNRPQRQEAPQVQDAMRDASQEIQQRKRREADALVPFGNEEVYELPSGKKALIVKATKENEEGRNNSYCRHTPLTPLDKQGYYILDENRDIVDFILLNNKDYDMEKTDHETSRFFKPWGNKNSAPDPKETSRELSKLQVKAQIREIERELIDKYGNDENDALDIPADEEEVIDFNRLHVINKENMAMVDDGDDLVGIGRRLLLEGVDNEDIKELYREAAFGEEVVPVNYHAMHFFNWTLPLANGGDKALELRGLTSYASIRRKLYELSELIPSSTMRLIDKLATDWVNDIVHTRFGYGKGAIDSFMLGIESLIDFFENEPDDVAKSFNAQASHLVNTVLYPHQTGDAAVRKAMRLDDEDSDDDIVFGSMMSVTLINIDSDKFAVNAGLVGGSVTRASWPSMYAAIETIRTGSKPQVSDYYIVTRDNCKMRIAITEDVGAYILEQG